MDSCSSSSISLYCENPVNQNVIIPALIGSDEDSNTGLPPEILYMILPYTDHASLGKGYEVSQLWRDLVILVVKDLYRIKAFGNAQWVDCGGREIVKNEDMKEEAKSLSLFIDELMTHRFQGKKAINMLDAGLILRMPKDLTLEKIGALVKLMLPGSGENGYEFFYPPEKQEHAGGSYWLWSSTTRIKDSGNKSYPVQRKMAAEQGYQDSHAREVAARLFAEFSLSGTFLCNDWYARCLDTRNGYPIVVGFGRSGLYVRSLNYGHAHIAVLGLLRWPPAEVRSSVLG
jgi:hypothetical protein